MFVYIVIFGGEDCEREVYRFMEFGQNQMTLQRYVFEERQTKRHKWRSSKEYNRVGIDRNRSVTRMSLDQVPFCDARKSDIRAKILKQIEESLSFET